MDKVIIDTKQKFILEAYFKDKQQVSLHGVGR